MGHTVTSSVIKIGMSERGQKIPENLKFDNQYHSVQQSERRKRKKPHESMASLGQSYKEETREVVKKGRLHRSDKRTQDNQYDASYDDESVPSLSAAEDFQPVIAQMTDSKNQYDPRRQASSVIGFGLRDLNDYSQDMPLYHQSVH